jgi:hypothetical protein
MPTRPLLYPDIGMGITDELFLKGFADDLYLGKVPRLGTGYKYGSIHPFLFSLK